MPEDRDWIDELFEDIRRRGQQPLAQMSENRRKWAGLAHVAVAQGDGFLNLADQAEVKVRLGDAMSADELRIYGFSMMLTQAHAMIATLGEQVTDLQEELAGFRAFMEEAMGDDKQ